MKEDNVLDWNKIWERYRKDKDIVTSGTPWRDIIVRVVEDELQELVKKHQAEELMKARSEYTSEYTKADMTATEVLTRTKEAYKMFGKIKYGEDE